LDTWLDDTDDGVGDLVLELKYILQVAIKFISPHVRTTFGLDQLACDAPADNPMDQDFETRASNLRLAPRCGARTRAGTACQRPAIRGQKRCRLHGGLSPGAPRGFRNGNFKNGDWTTDAALGAYPVESAASELTRSSIRHAMAGS
jgi:hypothetical protein